MNVDNDKQHWPLRYSLVRFFLLTFCLSWGFWIPEAAYAHGIGPVRIPVILSVIVGGFAPSLIAVILTGFEGGKTEVRHLWAQLFRWRVSSLWYGVALFLPLAIILCGIQISRFWTTPPSANLSLGNWPGIILVALFTLFFGGPLGEELGWRGYVLPRLLTSFGALKSGLMVGLGWGVWHLPLFFIPDTVQSQIPMGWFMLSILAESLVYTYLYQRTDGSLLIMLLLHTATNTWARLLLLPAIEEDITPVVMTFALEISLVMSAILLVYFLRRKKDSGCKASRNTN